jgi:hypothetical protein
MELIKIIFLLSTFSGVILAAATPKPALVDVPELEDGLGECVAIECRQIN